jgi:hexosaminidase
VDTPGHVWAGFAAIDGLLTTCYNPDGTVAGTGPLNPTMEGTYTFLKTLLAEIVPLFGEDMFMVGGDEVDYSCWLSNPEVVQWVANKGWGNGSAAMQKLESLYAQRLLEILADINTPVMCWEELFDNGLDLPTSTVVNVWRGGWEYCAKTTSGSTVVRGKTACSPAESTGGGGWFGRMRVRDGSWTQTMGRAAAAGYRTVLSSPFYLYVILPRSRRFNARRRHTIARCICPFLCTPCGQKCRCVRSTSSATPRAPAMHCLLAHSTH